jgi:hypothetical protein
MALVLDGNGTMTVGNGDITGLETGALPSTFIGTGAVRQVVSNTYSTSVASSSTTLVDSGLVVTITPTSSSSKILVMYSLLINGQSNDAIFGRTVLKRDSTTIKDNPSVFLISVQYPTNIVNTDTSCILDAPATTSPVTYKVQFARRSYSGSYGGTIYANYYADTPINISQITVMEIAG